MKEIRVCEIRAAAAADASKALRLEGRPIVYDQPTKILSLIHILHMLPLFYFFILFNILRD